MTDRELMQQGYEVPLVEQLDAVPRDARLWIENSDGMGSRHFPIGLMCHKAAEALRARLSAPEPEPVAIVSGYFSGQCVIMPINPSQIFNSGTAFYTAPLQQKEWQGLTDEEVYKLKIKGRDLEFVSMTGLRRFASDIETTLKGKNT